jgi:hypothetical protein
MSKDESIKQRIEIATRLMESWLKGPTASENPHDIDYKAAQFVRAAEIIQDASKNGTE